MERIENRRLLGAEIVDGAVLAGWEPSEHCQMCWADMVLEVQGFLTAHYDRGEE